MENELKKRAKYHRKRQRGLPALSKLKTNAGNVEYNVSMFNKMNSPVDGMSNNPISGPFGGDVSAPAVSGGMGESLCEDAKTSDMFEIKENTVILYYNDIPLIAQANFRDVDDWDEWEVNSDIAYEVDKWDIIDTLYSIVSEEEFPENMEDFTEEQADEWWKDNLETVLRKYQQQILDHYEYQAAEYGQMDIDGEQILRDAKADYEDDRYHQMKNERYDDDFDMSTRSLL